jgi:gluconate 2-dehydrogenase
MARRPAVLVTRRVFPEVLARLTPHFDVEHNAEDQPWSPDALRARLAGKAAAFITPTDRLDAAALAAAGPQLQVVANMAVGVNHIDIGACDRAGVVVTHTPGVLTEATADLGWALLMAAARRVTESERCVRAGQWRGWAVDQFLGLDVHGQTLGILGMGQIGQAVARRGAHGFGMRVLYHNRKPLPAAQETACGARWVSKAELLAQADHLVLVLPYSAETHHCIGAAELAAMKPTASLINLARGGIVDDAALARALSRGELAAAALDVFEGEPNVHPDLLTCDRAVLTPHIGSATRTARLAMAHLTADNLLAVLAGQPALTPAGQWHRPQHAEPAA